MKMTVVAAARAAARGVIIEIATWAWLGAAIIFFLSALVHWAGYGRDETDDRGAGTHSNMRLRTDHGTGCQYLESRQGSLTPRLSRTGQQVCR